MQTCPDTDLSVPPEAQFTEPLTVSEEDIDAVLEACGGNSRGTIRALLIGQQFLEAALEEARQEASWGYVRGRPSRKIRTQADAEEG